MIPDPFKPYLYGGAALALIVCTWVVQDWRWEAKLADAAEKADDARIALAQDNAEVIDFYASKETEINNETKITYKELANLSGDLMCTDTERMRVGSLWNKAARSSSSINPPVQ